MSARSKLRNYLRAIARKPPHFEEEAELPEPEVGDAISGSQTRKERPDDRD